MEDVEFRPQRGYRARLLQVACVLALAGAGIVFGMRGMTGLGVVAWVVAAGCLVGYAWRGRFCTRLTPRGMELHGYFNTFVPWDSITGIQVAGHDVIGSVPVAGGSGVLPVTTSPTSRRDVAAVRIVRGRRRPLRLRVPLVTGNQEDPEFTAKAELIRQRWRLAVTGSGEEPPPPLRRP